MYHQLTSYSQDEFVRINCRMPSPQMTSPSPGGAAPPPSPPKTAPNASGNYKPSRFGRPCDACKRRKQRCVFREGQDDVCLMCEFQSVPCTFTDVGGTTPNARKRTVPAGETTMVRKRRSKSTKYGTIVLGEVNWAYRTPDEEANERATTGASPASSSTPKEGSAPTPVLDRRPPGNQFTIPLSRTINLTNL
jgi:Fungal Zn(2)-Cys(6) binuclear cluster domain